MKGKFISSYVSKKGTDVFRYAISGTKEELATVEAVKGENHRVTTEQEIAEDGTVIPKSTPLAFLGSFEKNDCVLRLTTKGNIVAIDNDMQKLRSIVRKNGGNLGNMIAQEAGKSLLAQYGINVGVSTNAPVIKTETIPEKANVDLD
jgi:hypothetical protein